MFPLNKNREMTQWWAKEKRKWSLRTEMVADLFIGQKVIDRKKRELRQFLPMLNGLLKDLKRVIPDIPWKLLVTHGKWRFEMAVQDSFGSYSELRILGRCPNGHNNEFEEVIAGTSCSNSRCVCQFHIHLTELLELHAMLPAILNALMEWAPGLEKRLRVFLDQAWEIS